MHPFQRWTMHYISTCIGVGDQQAQQIWDEISRWKESQGGYHHVLSAYNPSILLPIAHVLVAHWPGRDCIVGFSVVARDYGIPSLVPINQLMDGLDPDYENLVRQYVHPNEVTSQRFYIRWMAVETAYDVLYQSPRSSPWDIQMASSTVTKARHLLTDIRDWRDNVMADTLERELRAIVRDFGSA